MPLKMFQKEEISGLSRVTNVIAVAAGKGGVGKSTVAVTLALALKDLGYSVGLMDTDIYGPSIRKMLPEDRAPIQKGKAITPAVCNGIRMISMAFFRKESEAAVVRAPIANGIISQFIQGVDWGDLDYLLLDFPPGTGDVQLTLSQQAHLVGAIVVTTPQEVAVMDVKKAMYLFEQVQVPIIGVVENMSYYQYEPTGEKIHLFGRGGGERLARESGVPFLAAIPIDPELCSCTDQGLSFLSKKNQDRPAAQSFLSLAKQIVEHVQAIKESSQSCLKQFEITWKEMPT